VKHLGDSLFPFVVTLVSRTNSLLSPSPVLVNGVTEEEALLDSGSQIVSMTRDVAAANKISWDPGLSIQLQSANGSLSRTCGLAKNVPFTLGDITVLLQAHIMETVPYKILLGRPFDAITKSTIVND